MRRAVAPAVLMLATLTACGGGEKPVPAASATPSASAALTEVAAVVRVLDTQLTKHKSLKMAVSVTGGEAAVKSDVLIHLEGTATRVDMTSEDPLSPGQKTHVIQTEEATYVAATGEYADWAKGKPWLKFGEEQKGMVGLIAPGGADSAVEDLARARDVNLYATGKLTSAPDPLGTHYTVTYDLGQALKQIGSKAYVAANFDQSLAAVKAKLGKEGLQKVMKGVPDLGEQYQTRLGTALEQVAQGVTCSYDVWVGADGLPAKLVMNVPLEGAAVKTEMVFSDWGTAKVTVPADDQAAEMPSPS